MQTSATLKLRRGESITFKLISKDLCINTSDLIERGHFRYSLQLFKRFLDESNGVRYLEDKAGARLVMMSKSDTVTFRTDHTIWTSQKSEIRAILDNLTRPYGDVRREDGIKAA